MAVCSSERATVAVEPDLDCPSCDGSGHGEQLSVDSFADCDQCHGDGQRRCVFCSQVAIAVRGRDAECEECIDEGDRAEARQKRQDDADGYGDYLRDCQKDGPS